MSSRRPGKQSILGWLSLFIAIPEGTWLAAAWRSGFQEKSVTNLSLEPFSIAILSVIVFFLWYLVEQKGLRPVVGIILLILLSAAALALHHYVPGLRE